jgi:hypothetical protein
VSRQILIPASNVSSGAALPEASLFSKPYAFLLHSAANASVSNQIMPQAMVKLAYEKSTKVA